jgi:hypothetical protein
MNIGVFWGKTGSGGQWHPAICHMVDVGQVAKAMVSRVLAPSAICRCQNTFAQTDS